MLKRLTIRETNNLFLKKNKMDILSIKKKDYLVKGLSTISANSWCLNTCLKGSIRYGYNRSNYKFTCIKSGKYGSPVSYLPYGRFVLLKKLTFNDASLLHKKSW